MQHTPRPNTSEDGVTYFASLGVSAIVSRYFGEVSIGGGLSFDNNLVPDLGIIITKGAPMQDLSAQFDLGVDGSGGMARVTLTGLEGVAISTNLSVVVPGVSTPYGGIAGGGSWIENTNGEVIAFQGTVSLRGGPIGFSQTRTKTTVFSIRRGIQRARSEVTDLLCSATGNC